MRLRAETTAKQNVNLTIGFWFPADTDVGNQGFGQLGYVLHIRGGIAEFIQETPRGDKLTQQDVERAQLAISINHAALNAILRAEAQGEAEFRKALDKRPPHKALPARDEDFPLHALVPLSAVPNI